MHTLTEGMERLQAMIGETGIPRKESKAKAADVMQFIEPLESKAKTDGRQKLESSITGAPQATQGNQRS